MTEGLSLVFDAAVSSAPTESSSLFGGNTMVSHPPASLSTSSSSIAPLTSMPPRPRLVLPLGSGEDEPHDAERSAAEDDARPEYFTAKVANRMAVQVHERDGLFRLPELEHQCFERVRVAVREHQRECTFEIPIARRASNPHFGSNSVLCEALKRYLERDMCFTVITRFSSFGSRILIRWQNDHTRDLSVAELHKRKQEVEERHAIQCQQQQQQQLSSYGGSKVPLPSEQPPAVFSAFHAVLYEREVHQRTIDTTLDQLVGMCINRIQQSITDRIEACYFEIPFAKFNVNNVTDRLLIYDRLVGEMTKRDFRITEQMRSSYKFKVSWLPEPEILLDEPRVSSAGASPLSPSPLTSSSSTAPPSSSPSPLSSTTSPRQFGSPTHSTTTTTVSSSLRDGSTVSALPGPASALAYTPASSGSAASGRSGASVPTLQHSPSTPAPLSSILTASKPKSVGLRAGFSEVPITARAQQLLNNYTRCLEQQQQTDAQLRQLQKHMELNVSLPDAFYEQQKLLLQRRQELGAYLATLQQIILKELSMAELFTQQQQQQQSSPWSSSSSSSSITAGSPASVPSAAAIVSPLPTNGCFGRDYGSS